MLISLFAIAFIKSNNSLLTLLIIIMFLNFLTFLVISLYAGLSVTKLHFNEIDAYNSQEYKMIIKKAKNKTILIIITFFLVERFIEITLNIINGVNFWAIAFSFTNNLIWLITSILFGTAIYYGEKHKINKF
jgi:hypothetical protein